MRLHRFIGNFDLQKTYIQIDERGILDQWRKVLRFKTHNRVILCDGSGMEAEVVIEELKKDVAQVRVVKKMKNEGEEGIFVTLYFSVLKRESFELVVQKATEIGVREIVPIITDRTVKFQFRRERLEKIIHEAAEQSGRGVVPKLFEAVSFSDAVKEAEKNGMNYFFDMSGNLFPSSQDRRFRGKKIGVFVGPEGGWSFEETARAKEARMNIVSLGTLVLRAETAAIVASFLVRQFTE